MDAGIEISGYFQFTLVPAIDNLKHYAHGEWKKAIHVKITFSIRKGEMSGDCEV
jgi:hypothetical protein